MTARLNFEEVTAVGVKKRSYRFEGGVRHPLSGSVSSPAYSHFVRGASQVCDKHLKIDIQGPPGRTRRAPDCSFGRAPLRQYSIPEPQRTAGYRRPAR